MQPETTDSPVVSFAIDGRVATLTLNRPTARNPLTPEVIAELVRLLRRADSDAQVKVVLINASGEHFSVGGDVKNFSHTLSLSSEERHDQFERRVLVAGRMAATVMKMSKPVVVAVRGAAAGAAMALCMAADFVVAADTSYFLAAQIHLGLSVDCGLSGLMVGAMGIKAAKRVALLGEKITSDQALSLGIVTSVVTAENVDSEASALAARLARGPALAMAGSKALLNHAAYMGFDRVLIDEASSIARCVSHADFVGGVEAILWKKVPQFE